MIHFWILLLSSSQAWAGPTVQIQAPVQVHKLGQPDAAKAKRTGSSSMMDAFDFSSCVKESVSGSTEGKCSSNSDLPSCLGLQKSLEYFRDQEECMHWKGSNCVEWGSRGRTQAQWMAIAAGHLSKFGVCIRKRYGSDSDNGLRAAVADSHLKTALKKLNDGASNIGYLEGDLLVKVLNGDRLSVILEASPLSEKYTSHDFFRIKDAADNPAKIDFIQMSEEEKVARRNLNSQDPNGDPFEEYLEAHSSSDSVSIGAELKVSQEQPAAIPQSENSIASQKMDRLPASSIERKISNRTRNPYSLGLDQSLFERVSQTYQRRAHEFRSIDELVRTQKIGPAKDFRELLQRGETL